jgi:hypothetical protein
MDQDPKSIGSKTGLHQTKKLLQSKWNNNQSEELTYGMDKMFSNYTSDKGSISRMYEELKNPIAKNKVIQLKSS